MDLFTVLIILFVILPVLAVLSISATTVLNILGWIFLGWGALMAWASDIISREKRWLIFIIHGIIALILFVIASSCKGQKLYDLIF